MSYDKALYANLAERTKTYAASIDSATLGYLARRGIGQNTARVWSLGTSTDEYAGRLAIPYLRDGGVVRINYRAVREGQDPKYLATAGAKSHLFNTEAFGIADQTGEIYICEGELDTVIANEHYGFNATGVPGATHWQSARHWRELFTGYDRVWVLADPDEAGDRMAEAICSDLPAARVIRLPYDVSDCHLKEVEIKVPL